MTKELFVKTVMELRKTMDKLFEVDTLLGVQWLETPFGVLLDLLYDVLIPGANDDVFEDFGDIIYGPNVTELDVEDFYDEYKESLD